VTPIPTQTRVVALQHPRERHNAIGTARIAALCLPSVDSSEFPHSMQRILRGR
jgi:DTW domain-containing protein YfiP